MGDESSAKEGSSGRSRFGQVWEEWIKSLGPILLLGVGVMLYRFDLLPEAVAGIGLILVVALGSLLATAWPAFSFVRTSAQKGIFWTMVLLWAVSSLYEPLRMALPSKVLAEVDLTADTLTQKVSLDSDGPFDVTVSGRFKQPGATEVDASYAIKVAGSAGAADVSGDIKRSLMKYRAGRRGGTATSLQEHTAETHRLSDVRGRELTISTEGVDEQLEGGVHVAIRQGSLPPIVFIILGAFAVLFALMLDARLVDFKGKLAQAYLTCGAAVAYVFSLRFTAVATPGGLVRPGIDALILGLLAGGLGGYLLGTVVRFMFAPKPAAPARS